jgi:hypothetical protein
VVENVGVSLDGPSFGWTTTDAAGRYAFDGLADGSYTVTPGADGYEFDPVSRSIVLEGADIGGQDFEARPLPHAITGTVTGPIAVTVNLTGAATQTTTTDGSGGYAFAGLADGSYTVTPSLASFTVTPASRAVTVSGADVTGQDFTAVAVPHVISGTVSGAVSQGVTMSLIGASSATTVTDSPGHYSFGGLANGTYEVTPALANFTFTPASRTVDVNGADVTGQDFTASAVTFVATGPMTTARVGHTQTLLQSGKVLVAGGAVGGVVLASAEVYDPTTSIFCPTGALGAARVGHTATLLSTGKVLIAGGSGRSGYVATAELYDPATGLFTTTGSLGTGRECHSATLLPSGKVLIAGGATTGGYQTASAELYDPATGLFTATGSLDTGRFFHTETLLPNGKVLLVGGSQTAGQYALASAELYDPTTGLFTATGFLASARAVRSGYGPVHGDGAHRPAPRPAHGYPPARG